MTNELECDLHLKIKLRDNSDLELLQKYLIHLRKIGIVVND